MGRAKRYLGKGMTRMGRGISRYTRKGVAKTYRGLGKGLALVATGSVGVSGLGAKTLAGFADGTATGLRYLGAMKPRKEGKKAFLNRLMICLSLEKFMDNLKTISPKR